MHLFFVVISTVFADDMNVTVRGYFDLSQGVFVLIDYFLFIITIINLVREHKLIKMITWVFIFIGFIIGLIEIGQYFGYDILGPNLENFKFYLKSFIAQQKV